MSVSPAEIFMLLVFVLAKVLLWFCLIGGTAYAAIRWSQRTTQGSGRHTPESEPPLSG